MEDKKEAMGSLSFEYDREDEEKIILALSKVVARLIKKKRLGSAINFKFEGFPNMPKQCFRMYQLPNN